MDGPRGHYAKWNKSDRERQIPYDIIYMGNLKTHELIDTEKWLVFARGREWGLGKVDEGGQKEQTSSYKIHKSWGCNVQHGDCS